MAVAVRGVTVKPMRDRRRKRVEARVFDESGPLVAVWFNQPWIARQLAREPRCCCTASCAAAASSGSPSTSCFGDGSPVHTVGLVPVHPATEGISAASCAS